MDLTDQIVAWLGQLVFLVIGAVLGFFGSWLTARYSRKLRKVDEAEKSAQDQKLTWKQCLTDLLGEVEQNLQYQFLDLWIPLETGAYERLRHQGLTTNFDANLQIELRKAYAQIHQKNNRIRYYESFMTSIPLDQRSRHDDSLLAPIQEVHKQIDNELFKLKPKLMELLRKSG